MTTSYLVIKVSYKYAQCVIVTAALYRKKLRLVMGKLKLEKREEDLYVLRKGQVQSFKINRSIFW